MADSIGKKFRVLIADDNQPMRSMLKSLLGRLNKFSVIDEAADGEEAWKIMVNTELKYDIFTLDISMPKLDGLSLLRRYREDISLEYRPIIMITGDNDPYTVSNAIESGADYVIVKPFSTKLLYENIEILLDRYNDPMENAYREIERLNKNRLYQDALDQLNSVNVSFHKSKWIILKGEILTNLGNTEDASICFESVAESTGTYYKALTNYANLQQKLKNNPLAIEALKKLDVINPFNVARKINLGDLLLKEGEMEEGKEFLDNAIKMASGNKDIKFKIAEVFSDNGYIVESRNIFNEIMEDGNVKTDFCYKLGISFRRQKKYKEAEELYLIALKNNPNDKILLYNIGILYLDMKENAQACNYFLQAVRIDHQFKEAREILEKFCPQQAKKLIYYT